MSSKIKTTHRLVSVVVPTRNRAGRVGTAVRSALAQTVGALEVVVVDDASEDDTPAILEALKREDPRVRIVRSERRGGAPLARNLGAAHASGEYLAFLDDDCVWHPQKLEAQLQAMSQTHGASYAVQATMDVDGRWILEGRALPESTQIEGILRTNFIGAPSLVVNRDIFQRLGGFDEGLPRLQDWDLVLALIRRTQLAFVPRVLVRSQLVSGGISTDRSSLPRAAERILRRHAPHLTRSQAAALHYGLAKFLLVEDHRRAAQKLFREATRLDPGSATNWAGLVAGVLGPAPARAIRTLRRRFSLRRHGSGESGPMELPSLRATE